MRVVIIPSDNLITVDGFSSANVDLSSIPADVHAMQWFDSHGWLEFNRDSEGRKPPNEDLESLDAYQAVIAECLQHKQNAEALAAIEQAGGLPDADSVKKLAQGELTRTDWTQLPDVNLLNKAEFAVYRDWCRKMYLNPMNPDDPSFVLQESPEPIWGPM
jgi:hypothetical protein